jgi:hypothetical protein
MPTLPHCQPKQVFHFFTHRKPSRIGVAFLFLLGNLRGKKAEDVIEVFRINLGEKYGLNIWTIFA